MANFDRVNEGLERIRTALRHAGYLDAKATTRRTIDDPKKTVNVSVSVDPGALFTMGKLEIKGLDLDGEAEITRIWTLKEGKPFNPVIPTFSSTACAKRACSTTWGPPKPMCGLTPRRTRPPSP